MGQAASYGAGCWAQESVGISTSGSGEYLVKTLFARECASYFLSNTEQSVESFNDMFISKFTGKLYIYCISIMDDNYNSLFTHFFI